MTRRGLMVLISLAAASGAPSAAAQRSNGPDYLFRAPAATITLHGGFANPTAGSDIFSFTMDELTVGKSDFLSGSIGVDLALMLQGPLDLVVGFSRAESRTRSEFRDWVDNNNLPIEQTTRFLRQPFTASLRYNFASRGRQVGSIAWIPARFVPFIGIGGGVMRYRFEQVGDFIDTVTLEVFPDQFVQQAWSPVAQASAGATWSIRPLWQIVGEVRYLRGKGERSRSGDDFVGFERLDLSGLNTTIGISLRF